jgi:hypothetical protein
VQTEDPHYLVEGSKKYPSLQVKWTIFVHADAPVGHLKHYPYFN